MSAPLATQRSVEHAIQRNWVENPRPERVMLLHARPEWGGPSTLAVGDVSARVCAARSTLAVRDAVTAQGDTRVVVVTDLGNDELAASLVTAFPTIERDAVKLIAVRPPPPPPPPPGETRTVRADQIDGVLDELRDAAAGHQGSVTVTWRLDP